MTAAAGALAHRGDAVCSLEAESERLGGGECPAAGEDVDRLVDEGVRRASVVQGPALARCIPAAHDRAREVCRFGEEEARQIAHHVGRAAAVLTQVEDQRVGARELGHRCVGAWLRCLAAGEGS